ncbi:MAG: DNA mismatch repair endonuclease MutL [Spirochaetia bacterium]|nr:DNA mismatch repair endonuclease MutL [Spirochaetia bacterium]
MAIHKLTDLIIAQIAAGEVIESPVAVVKELIENSIDAGSKKIEIYLRDMGMTSLQVRDDGKGIGHDDLPLALESFATSKINSSDDLFEINSMGFRGEALSSIRSVSKVTIESKLEGSDRAWKIYGEGDFISKPESCALPSGTRILVENLFFNVPIRKKFLHSDVKIKQSIIELLISYAISYPETGFVCTIDDDQVLNSPPSESLYERLEQIYSNSFMKSMTPFYFKDHENDTNIKIEGYLSGSGFYHSRSIFIKFFVNRRPVIYLPLIKLLKKAYGELLPPGKFPAAFIFVEIDPSVIDVNVHPQKKEIRFKDDAHISDAVYKSILRGIENKGSVNISHKLRFGIKNITNRDSNLEKSYNQSLEFDTPIYVSEINKPVIEVPLQLKSEGLKYKSKINQPEMIHSRLFDTFILASSREGVFLIDQHTAHERIQYEMYLKKIRQNEASKQTLLSSVVVELSPSEKILLNGNFKVINDFGFDIEDFGPAGIKITSVPSYLARGQESEGIRVLLNILSGDAGINQEIMFDHMAKSLSCRSAIKKGEQASLEDYSEIIGKLYECEHPFRCPHGRPTVIHLSKNDILGFFNRPTV